MTVIKKEVEYNEYNRNNKGNYMMTLLTTGKELTELETLFAEALTVKGVRQKQWFLERLAEKLEVEIQDSVYEKGVKPS